MQEFLEKYRAEGPCVKCDYATWQAYERRITSKKTDILPYPAEYEKLPVMTEDEAREKKVERVACFCHVTKSWVTTKRLDCDPAKLPIKK